MSLPEELPSLLYLFTQKHHNSIFSPSLPFKLFSASVPVYPRSRSLRSDTSQQEDKANPAVTSWARVAH